MVMLARAHDPQVLADVGDLLAFSIRFSLPDHRQRATRELATLAGTRTRLEELHDVLLDRLHQRSCDFDASRALAMTIAALRYWDDSRAQ
jgi:hypothetical protein